MSKLEKAKKKFRGAYSNYYEYLDLFDCTENLALYMSPTLRDLGLKMIEKLQKVIDAEEELHVTAPDFLYEKIDEYKDKFQYASTIGLNSRAT